MEKPKQEDFETETIYIVALENYIKLIHSNHPLINLEKKGRLPLMGANEHGINYYKKTPEEIQAINEAFKKPDKIIKITNRVKDVIYIDLDKVEYIRKVNESIYKVYLTAGRIFELKDEDFELLKLINLWKESKK